MKHSDRTFSAKELSGTEYTGDSFHSCRFPVPIHFTTFEDCQFEDCDFTGCSFDNIHFSKSSFPGSKLSYLDFANCRFVSCSFDQAVINNSIFQQFKPGTTNTRSRYDLTSCSYEKTELENSVFARCNLKGVNFAGANLRSVVFEGCDLTSANLVDATVENTGLDTSKLDGLRLSLSGFLAYGATKGFVLEEAQV